MRLREVCVTVKSLLVAPEYLEGLSFSAMVLEEQKIKVVGSIIFV